MITKEEDGTWRAMPHDEKVLKLLQLVWPTKEIEGQLCVIMPSTLGIVPVAHADPYKDGAVFAAIFLRFTEVMCRFTCCARKRDGSEVVVLNCFDATQGNILDEILRMQGVAR